MSASLNPQIWVRIAVFSTCFGGIVLPIIVGLLTPGPKGILRQQRSENWRGLTLEQAWKRLIERLAANGFHIVSHVEQRSISAVRPRGFASGDRWAARTHARMELHCELSLELTPYGITVTATLSNASRVFLDTGETAHMTQVLDYLLCPEQVPAEAEPVRNRSFRGKMTFCLALLLWVWVAIIASGKLPAASSGYAVHGMAIALFVTLVLGINSVVEIRLHPREMYGMSTGVAGIALALAALAATPAAFYMGYRSLDHDALGAWALFCRFVIRM